MAEPILSDNLEKALIESNLSITSNDINIELSKEFLVELRKNIYHGTYNEDVVDHIVKESKYENPPNTATDSFFKAYDARDIEKQNMDKAKITRKRSKTGKHGHENGRAQKKLGNQAKVKKVKALSQLWVNKSQPQKDKTQKSSKSVL
ncbi:hypothetical protein Tco_1497272 [Tanacetum coccineum]